MRDDYRIVVPTWATVVITLGGSAIAALAGGFGSYLGFRTARLNLRHQTREAWRARMMEAAEDFLTVANALSWSVRTRLFASPGIPGPVEGDSFEEEWGELRRAQIRVDLAFGVTSPSSDRAADIVKLIGDGAAALATDETEPDSEHVLEDARDGFLAESEAYDAFLAAAHAAVSPADE